MCPLCAPPVSIIERCQIMELRFSRRTRECVCCDAHTCIVLCIMYVSSSVYTHTYVKIAEIISVTQHMEVIRLKKYFMGLDCFLYFVLSRKGSAVHCSLVPTKLTGLTQLVY